MFLTGLFVKLSNLKIIQGINTNDPSRITNSYITILVTYKSINASAYIGYMSSINLIANIAYANEGLTSQSLTFTQAITVVDSNTETAVN
jgi:general stress protein CsbA